jgi:hypothetical protein
MARSTSPLRTRGTLITVLAAALLCARAARAQNAANQAAAEALFDQGKAAMDAKDYAKACPLFFESNRLDQGLGTSLWLADCYEKNGQTASAWAEFREAAALAVKFIDPREKVARERALALERRLARLLVLVPANARIPGLHVARDGGEITSALWGTSVPVDPGPHTVVVSAPDHRPQTLTITVLPGPGEQALVVPLLQEAPVAPAPVVLDNTAIAVAGPVAPAHSSRPARRAVAIVAGGVGVVGVALGSYFGLHAKSELGQSNSDHHCWAGNQCDATGVADRSSAQSSATASTALFIAGGVALASGIVLWLTAPSTSKAASARLVPWVDARGGGVMLGSGF